MRSSSNRAVGHDGVKETEMLYGHARMRRRPQVVDNRAGARSREHESARGARASDRSSHPTPLRRCFTRRTQVPPSGGDSKSTRSMSARMNMMPRPPGA